MSTGNLPGATMVDKMRAFDELRGKSPINSSQIEGFGAGSPPPPPPAAVQPLTAAEGYGVPVEVLMDPDRNDAAETTSPLVNLGVRTGAPASAAPAVPAEKVTEVIDDLIRKMTEVPLWVRNEEASYRGRPVTLTSEEVAEISQVVIRAIRRDLDKQFEEISGTKPRRRRKRGSPKKSGDAS